MKLKYYLRGLGFGVICTAIIMGIALSGNKKEKLTDAEIIERARLLGMVMEEDSGDKSSEKKETEAEQKEDSKTPENQDNKAKEEKDDKDKDDDGESDSVKPEEEKKDEPSDSSSPTESTENSGDTQNMVEFEIKQGEFSDVVSQKLFQAGLIPDAEEFNNYMTQKGVDDSLRVGVHLIPAGATQDEIIEILQGKPQ